jgi:phosphatidylserine/phosphatidylglycerophosphate/cardiolipin synthase-like enzyme
VNSYNAAEGHREKQYSNSDDDTAVFLSTAWSHGAELTLRDVRVQVYFSPGGGATEAIAREIGAARKEVLVQAYVLSSQPISEALLNAHKKGVAVKLILDKSERGEGLTPGTIHRRGYRALPGDGRPLEPDIRTDGTARRRMEALRTSLLGFTRMFQVSAGPGADDAVISFVVSVRRKLAT